MTSSIIGSYFLKYLGLSPIPINAAHTGLQHVAFESGTLDDLLGTYTPAQKLGHPARLGSRSRIYIAPFGTESRKRTP